MTTSKVRALVLCFCLLAFAFELAGCESLAKKFVRKPKEEKKTDDVVFAPEEYKGEGVSKQDLYRQYFLYWRTWQDELIDSLERGANHKRQLDSLDEGIRNLENIKPLIKPEVSARLDGWINSLRLLREAVAKDLYSNNFANNRREAERLKREIMREFSFSKIKDSIL